MGKLNKPLQVSVKTNAFHASLSNVHIQSFPYVLIVADTLGTWMETIHDLSPQKSKTVDMSTKIHLS